MAALTAGLKFYAKSTGLNRNCQIQPGDCGFITRVESSDVSFYLERRGGAGYMEATCRLDVFGANFAADWRLAGLTVEQLADGGYGQPIDLAYAGARMHAARFPDRFL